MNRKKRNREQSRLLARLRGDQKGLVEAQLDFNENEWRLFFTMLTRIKPEDEEFKPTKISLSDMIKMWNISKTGLSYRRLRDAARTLGDRKFYIYTTFEGDAGRQWVHLLSKGFEPENEELGYIVVQFNDALKPQLLQLKDNILSLNIDYLIMLVGSNYAMRLYMLLKYQIDQFNRKPKYSLERFRDLLVVRNNAYPLYGNLKQSVIMKAVRDINAKTDLHILDVKEVTRNKTVTDIIFILDYRYSDSKGYNPELIDVDAEVTTLEPGGRVKRRERVKAGPAKLSEEAVQHRIADTIFANEARLSPENKEFLDEIQPVLEAWGVTTSAAIYWVEAFPQDKIRRAIRYTQHMAQKGSKIDNFASYLSWAITSASEKQLNVPARAPKKSATAASPPIPAAAPRTQTSFQTHLFGGRPPGSDVGQDKEKNVDLIRTLLSDSRNQIMKLLLESEPRLIDEFLQDLRAPESEEILKRFTQFNGFSRSIACDALFKSREMTRLSDHDYIMAMIRDKSYGTVYLCLEDWLSNRMPIQMEQAKINLREKAAGFDIDVDTL